MDKITHALIFNGFSVIPTEDKAHLHDKFPNVVAAYGLVDVHDGIYEAYLDDEQQKIYDEQQSKISLNEALKGKCVDLTQFVSQEEIDLFTSISACFVLRDVLHHIGVSDDDDIHELTEKGVLVVEALAHDHYGTLWAVKNTR